MDKAKNQFILTTQHHLRTPLTIIKGFLETALNQKSKNLDTETVTYLQKAATATERMARLIGDFLNVSQMEVGKTIFNLQSVNMKDLLMEIMDELSSEIDKKNLTTKIDFTPEAGDALLNVDRNALKAAFYNLIDNAVKYTRQGSIIIGGTIVTHPIERIRILRVTIRDTGIGISREELGKLFNQYFQRGEEAEKIYTTGRGIGLVLSKNIIKSHRGQIFAESKGPGYGATFIVELPIL